VLRSPSTAQQLHQQHLITTDFKHDLGDAGCWPAASAKQQRQHRHAVRLTGPAVCKRKRQALGMEFGRAASKQCVAQTKVLRPLRCPSQANAPLGADRKQQGWAVQADCALLAPCQTSALPTAQQMQTDQGFPRHPAC